MPDREIQLGDKVRLNTLNQTGIVTTLSEDEAEVQLGMLRVRTRLTELKLVNSNQDDKGQDIESRSTLQDSTSFDQGSKIETSASPGIELDLRGYPRR